MNWNDISKRFSSIPEGCLVTDKEGTIWIKPVQSIEHHLDDMLVSLKDGSLSHYSKVMKHLKD